jgi:glutaredoxin
MSNDGMNRGVGVRIVTLSDCDYCMWLKSELDGCGINYTNIDAEMFNDFSDEIENRLKTETYPMVFIDLGSNVIALVGETSLETNETLRTFNTIPELIGIIKSYIK